MTVVTRKAAVLFLSFLLFFLVFFFFFFFFRSFVSFGLNAGLMHELRQFREGQIIGAEKQGVVSSVVAVSVVATRHLRMVGLLGLV